LDEELSAYLEMAAVEKMKLGMSRKEALRAVRLEQGTLELTREVVRSSSWESVVENCWRDLRFAARMLRKAPGFTAVAVLTLALGIGANTAIFSLLNAVMLKTMPVSRPEQLVILRWAAHSRPQNVGTSSYGDCLWVPGAIQSCSFSFPMYKALFAHTDAFSSVLAMAGAGQLDLSGNGPASIVGGELVSGNYFETLCVSSALGRTIQPSDDRPGAPPVVVLSYGYWQRRFAGDRSAIGRNIRVDSRPREIVGVMPQRFQLVNADFDLIVPLAFDRGKLILADFGFHGIARLKPGFTITQANVDVARMIPIWMDSWSNGPGSNPHVYETWRITPAIRSLKQEVIGNIAAEEDNLLAAWRLARAHGWWHRVVSTMQGLRTLYDATGRSAAWRRLVDRGRDRDSVPRGAPCGA